MAMDMLPMKGYHVVMRETPQSIDYGFAGKEEPARRLLKGQPRDEESLQMKIAFFFRCFGRQPCAEIDAVLLNPLAHAP